MKSNAKSGQSVAVKTIVIIFGALMTLIGMLSAAGDFSKLLDMAGAGGGLVSFAKSMEKLHVWTNTTIALLGLLLVGGVLNGVA